MTNPDPHPTEVVCTEAGTGAQLLEPRAVPLGGVRAMTVRRTLPQRARSLIGAWCFVDHYGPDRVADTGGMDVPPHPHTGLQTVSWLFSGTIEHRDSAGFHALVRPGEVNLMTAGSGISHSERSTPDTDLLHGVQLWVALPDRARQIGKTFAHHVPDVVSGPGWRGQVFLGSLLGHTSPVTTHTPLLGAEITLDAGAELDLEVEPGFEHGILVDAGALAVDDEPVPAHHLLFRPVGASRLRLRAGEEPVRLLLLGGPPFGEQIVMWWNFVGRDHDEIVQFRDLWMAEIAGGPSHYGLPSDDPDDPLPAPRLPDARIRPRA